MSDDEITEGLSTLSLMDQLKAKHKKESKELEAKTTKLRHSVPKGDKKRMKEVKEEISKLETEMKARHESELKAAVSNDIPSEKPSVAPSEETDDANLKTDHGEKLNTSRAQRRREKKAAVSAAQAEKAAQAVDNTAELLRDLERSRLAGKLEQLGLTIHEVSPNGDCLFSSIAHQLDLVHGIPSTVAALRLQAAEEMRENIDDYLPFMENPTDDAGFLIYCNTMETTHEWGGQMELRALSRALNLPIRVIQAEGADVELFPNDNRGVSQPLLITYHRHEFGLGEHYNSTEPWEKA